MVQSTNGPLLGPLPCTLLPDPYYHGCMVIPLTQDIVGVRVERLQCVECTGPWKLAGLNTGAHSLGVKQRCMIRLSPKATLALEMPHTGLTATHRPQRPSRCPQPGPVASSCPRPRLLSVRNVLSCRKRLRNQVWYTKSASGPPRKNGPHTIQALSDSCLCLTSGPAAFPMYSLLFGVSIAHVAEQKGRWIVGVGKSAMCVEL
jgi:hypothetical protein